MQDHQCIDFDVFRLQTPFRAIFSGVSQSGKSTYLYNLLSKRNEKFDKQFTKIIICYAKYQKMYQELKEQDPNLFDLREGLVIDLDNDPDINKKPILYVIDDLFTEFLESELALDLFTRSSHHQNVSVILITQKLFPQEKYATVVAENSTYLFLFFNPRGVRCIRTLASQMLEAGQTDFLIGIYKDATDRASYDALFIDCSTTCPEQLRYKSNFLSSHVALYQPACYKKVFHNSPLN
jgi:hypothetical protein